MKAPPAFRFAAASTANRLVAGIPAAARLARAYAAVRPAAPLVLEIGDGGSLTAATLAEITRLAPGAAVTLVDPASRSVIPAEPLLDAGVLSAVLDGTAAPPPAPADPAAALAEAAQRIIRATAKPSDGIIARTINRPLSQAISGPLLRLGWVRPGHATALTALAAAAMLVCLLAVPTPTGLAAGAVLFQIASVLDGVDGEIARASLRSSKAGASFDSLVDAFTNCGFLAGAGISFALQGQSAPALVCAGATVVQIAGLTILGSRAWRREGVVHFDSAKAVVAPVGGGLGRALKDLTSRDFYCFAFMLASLAGALAWAMMVFLAASLVWFAVVIRTALQPSPAR